MIGLTSVTFRKLSCGEIIRMAQESGAQCIEWGGDIHVTNVETAMEVREQCAQAGLKVRSFGSYYRVGSGETERFRRCRAERVCIRPPPYRRNPRLAWRAGQRKNLRGGACRPGGGGAAAFIDRFGIRRYHCFGIS